MKNDILVSICCITYNHQDYISKCLDGMLMQKTNFKFEILINDDASTDNTANIIREYEKKYPNIIKPIYQEENQFSKKIKTLPILYKKAVGKYIAICEGDDYWIDENKLQKQIDYMEKNENCTFCFHNAKIFDQKKQKYRKFVPYEKENQKYLNRSGVYNAGELLLLGFVPTASFVFRTSVVEKIPKWFYEAKVGDLSIKLLASCKGYAYFINDEMSIYRVNAGNSLMDKWKKENRNIEKNIEHCESYKKLAFDFDEYTEKKYHDYIVEFCKQYDYLIAYLTFDYEEIRKNKYKNMHTLKNKIKMFLKKFIR